MNLNNLLIYFFFPERLYALQLPTSDRNKYKNLNMSEGVDCNCPFSCTEIDYVPEVSAAGTKPASRSALEIFQFPMHVYYNLYCVDHRTLARLDQMGVFDKFGMALHQHTYPYIIRHYPNIFSVFPVSPYFSLFLLVCSFLPESTILQGD